MPGLSPRPRKARRWSSVSIARNVDPAGVERIGRLYEFRAGRSPDGLAERRPRHGKKRLSVSGIKDQAALRRSASVKLFQEVSSIGSGPCSYSRWPTFAGRVGR